MAYAIVTHTSESSDFIHPELDFDRAKAAAIHHVRSMMIDSNKDHYHATGEVRDLETEEHDTLFLLDIRDVPVHLVDELQNEEPAPRLSRSSHGYAVYIRDNEFQMHSHEVWSDLSEQKMVYQALLDFFNGVEIPKDEHLTMQAWLFYGGILRASAWLEAQGE